MVSLSLNIKTRDKKAGRDSLEKEGLIPAVYYGRTQKSTPVSISLVEFNKIWKEAGESSVITLENEKGKGLDALIYNVDVDPVKNIPRHADFYVFEEGKTVEVNIPLEFTGSSPAVKELGGILIKVFHEISVEASPRDLPHNLEVDISLLVDFESQILAKDISLPKGVTLKDDPESVVASISEPKEEEEEAVSEEVDFSNIEVEKKGKDEETDQTEGSEDADSKESDK